jgi:HAD superfamily hydrolase (TIGR01509 family)
MSGARPAAIIFDMDGVLLDSEPLHMIAMNQVLAAHGHAVDEAEFNTFVGASSDETWAALARARGLPDDAALYIARYSDAVATVLEQQATPMPGLLPLLADLRAAGMPLAVGSTSPLRWIEVSLRRCGIRDYFTAIVSGEMVARPKPAPDIFLRAAELLGAPPARCLVIEDSGRGLEAARAAGMFAVALRRPEAGHALDVTRADLVTPSLPAFHAWWRAQGDADGAPG